MTTNLEAALSYIQRGWSVVPLRADKKRSIVAWKRFQEKAATEFDAKAWFGRWPDANLAVICGRISGIAVLDIDPRNGGTTPDNLPTTYTVKTAGGGLHYYFKLPEDEVVMSGIFAPGVDFIAEGEYVVAPPSSIDSKDYAWVDNDTELADLPSWVRAIKAKSTRDSEMAKIEGGVRNSTLTSLAGAMRRQGLWFDPIYTMLQMVNADKCDPPLEDEEVYHIAQGVDKYTPTFEEGVRPSIVVNNRQDREVIEDLFSALEDANTPPWLFQRDGLLTRVVSSEDGGLTLETLSPDALMVYASRHANWITRGGSGVREVSPPRQLIRETISIRETRFPLIRALVEVPIFDRDGTLTTEAGYMPGAQMYCWPNIRVETPDAGDIDWARDLILGDLLGDFPFVDEASRAHALAAVLLPFCRAMVNGPTPLHLIDAPTPGTGKSLIANLVNVIATGRVSDPITGARDSDEWRKRITAALIEAPNVVVFDNLSRKIDNPHLAAALSTTSWSDRELGASRTLTLPIHCTWIATGNNLPLSNEIARRTVLCRLDAGMARPWNRSMSEFRHPHIIQWATENRADLIRACLTLVIVGMKDTSDMLEAPVLGGFETWAVLMGRILKGIGVEGFLSNQESAYEAAVEEEDEWEAFVEIWFAKHGDSGVRTTDLRDLALDNELLVEALGSGGDNSQSVKMGQSLRTMRGRTVGKYKITVRIIPGGRKLYALMEAKNETKS